MIDTALLTLLVALLIALAYGLTSVLARLILTQTAKRLKQ